MDLTGRNALVTGAARGLGEAIVVKLAGAGARVWAADIREEALASLAGRYDGQVSALSLDVRDGAAVEEAVGRAWRDADGIDVLVNCAAVDVTKPIEHLTPEEADRVVATNLLGPINLCLATYKRMVGRGGGHIVNILSTAAQSVWTEAGPYAASKTGLRAFTRTLYREAQRDCLGVGVTGIIAGGMETPFILERFPDADTAKLQDPAIVADTVLYALSVPETSLIPELVVIPRDESSWP